MGLDVLITIRGRKSGKPCSTPVTHPATAMFFVGF